MQGKRSQGKASGQAGMWADVTWGCDKSRHLRRDCARQGTRNDRSSEGEGAFLLLILFRKSLCFKLHLWDWIWNENYKEIALSTWGWSKERAFSEASGTEYCCPWSPALQNPVSLGFGVASRVPNGSLPAQMFLSLDSFLCRMIQNQLLSHQHSELHF